MKPTVEINVNAQYWSCECCGGVYDENATITINKDIHMEFFHDAHFGYGSWNGSVHLLYLGVLDVLGYSVIGKGTLINEESNKEIANVSELEIDYYFNPKDNFNYYAMDEEFLKAKNKLDYYPLGDNNIVIEVFYERKKEHNIKLNGDIQEYFYDFPASVVLSFPHNESISFTNDGIEWNGDHDDIFKKTLEYIVELKQTSTDSSSESASYSLMD